MWTREFDILSSAARSTVWAVWADVNGWTRWNPAVDDVRIAGPFASGTRFLVTPRGQPTFTGTLLDVQREAGFTDETVRGELCVRMEHRIEAVPGGRLRLVCRASVSGPDEAAAGEALTADVNEVLATLVAAALQAESEMIAA